MKNSMKKQKMIVMALSFLLTVVWFFPALCFAAGPTAGEYGVVLNLSGKQRMLTQKMSKEVMLIALDIDRKQNLRNLADTSALFDKTIYGLRDGNSELRLPPTVNPDIISQLDRIINNYWKDFYKVIKEIASSGKEKTPS